MKKFLNKKLLFILALFLFFILINFSTVRAESVLVTSDTYNKAFIDSYIDAGQSPRDAFKKIVDDYNELYPDVLSFTSADLPPYYVLYETYFEGNLTYYNFIFSEYPLLYYDTSYVGRLHLSFNHPEGISSQKYYTVSDFTDGGFTFGSRDILSTDGRISSFTAGTNLYTPSIIASNYDLIDQFDGTVFFQPPTLRKATTLAPVIQREKTKGTLQVVLTEIMQILPLIILVLVSFLGLRKALKMLFAVLRRS